MESELIYTGQRGELLEVIRRRSTSHLKAKEPTTEPPGTLEDVEKIFSRTPAAEHTPEEQRLLHQHSESVYAV